MRFKVLTLGLVALVWTEPVFSTDYNFEAGEIESLQIVGYKGDLEVVGGSNSKTLKVEIVGVGDSKAPGGATWSWAPSLRRIGSKAELRIDGPMSKKDWQAILTSGQWPQYKVRVSGASIPLQLYWREGSLQLNNWKADVDAHILDGRITSRGGQGRFLASLQQGPITVKSQKGLTEISGLDMSADLQDIEGDLTVRSSRGAISLKGVKGLVTLENELGKTVVNGLNGALNFTNGRGDMSIAKVSGGVDGKTAVGTVDLTYSGEGEVQIGSQSGPVTLRIPKEASPYVVMTSEEGDLFVPSYFGVIRSSAGKTAKGRVRGASREGSIKVTSKSADIFLR